MLGVPCLQYIDDRHVGPLRVAALSTASQINSWSNRELSEAAAYILLHLCVSTGYFIALDKSILLPVRSLVLLGMTVDTTLQAFIIPDSKKARFVELVESALAKHAILITTLQKVKCISFSLAIPCARIYIRQMAHALSKAQTSAQNLVRVNNPLREELKWWIKIVQTASHFKWLEERHTTLQLYTDSSSHKWGAVFKPNSTKSLTFSDSWEDEWRKKSINEKETEALARALIAVGPQVTNTRLNVFSDSAVLVHAWNAGFPGSKSISLNDLLKKIFSFCIEHNTQLNIAHVRSQQNLADRASRELSMMNAKLSDQTWNKLEREFGPHTLDGMATYSNARLKDFISPFPQHNSAGVDFFHHHFSRDDNIYLYPPFSLTHPVVKHIVNNSLNATVVIHKDNSYPAFWPMVAHLAVRILKLANRGDSGVILAPSTDGYKPCSTPCELFAARFVAPATSSGDECDELKQ
ncbi:uncharacterized protein [Ptychodera flava]|uniref:uncharacterized protein n=1 Tax=Ptychodera flava TaxID=63121 RepID=UPI00396A5AF6